MQDGCSGLTKKTGSGLASSGKGGGPQTAYDITRLHSAPPMANSPRLPLLDVNTLQQCCWRFCRPRQWLGWTGMLHLSNARFL